MMVGHDGLDGQVLPALRLCLAVSLSLSHSLPCLSLHIHIHTHIHISSLTRQCLCLCLSVCLSVTNCYHLGVCLSVCPDWNWLLKLITVLIKTHAMHAFENCFQPL
ncbi:hypothetical protein BJ741DRAFT_271618 [Chytriomyces cf. hyalinus JEL632]|nr:hypothetical protein BJ741DRAFT_271618 [Chytriomyces cf. hyalinus JEL632]